MLQWQGALAQGSCLIIALSHLCMEPFLSQDSTP